MFSLKSMDRSEKLALALVMLPILAIVLVCSVTVVKHIRYDYFFHPQGWLVRYDLWTGECEIVTDWTWKAVK